MQVSPWSTWERLRFPLAISAPTIGTPGTPVQVRGSGFTAGITATVGGQSASVTFTDENTLTLTLPTLSSGPHDLTILRPDGVSYTLASAIVDSVTRSLLKGMPS